MIRLILIFGLLLFSSLLTAQELNCKLNIQHNRIQNTDPKVFKAMEQAILTWLNTQKWTNEQFNNNEKIDCSFQLTLTGKQGENIYNANLNIQASRPVFNTSYQSPLINYIDRDVIFKFEETQTLMYDDNRVSGSDAMASNLTAVFAFYCYLILGLDYDSFAPEGGNALLRKAQHVVLNAPEEASAITGWKSSQGTRNRYWIIDQILSPKFDGYRMAWYNFHRQGLDVMSKDPEAGKKAILNVIPLLSKINSENPTSILMQLHFNTKSLEYQNILRMVDAAERKQYIDQITQMDIPNAVRYRNL